MNFVISFFGVVENNIIIENKPKNATISTILNGKGTISIYLG